MTVERPYDERPGKTAVADSVQLADGLTMWATDVLDTAQSGRIRFAILDGSKPVSYGDFVRGLRHDEAFRSWFNAVLAAAPFSAFRWETRPVALATLSHPFECVLIDSPGLDRPPDPDAFREHFERRPELEVLVFPNLGGDASMIVPRPLVSAPVYGHIAAFVRGAPESQRDALWRAVGDATAERIGSDVVWLSTAGAGVAWLHVRLDDQPKYYDFEPYLSVPPG